MTVTDTEERIVIPYNEAGKPCFEVLYNIALKQLHRARGTTEKYIKAMYPTAELVDEHAMVDKHYYGIYAVGGGEQQKVVYDYRTKYIEIIGG